MTEKTAQQINRMKSYGGAFLMAQRRMNAEMFGADLFG